MAITEPQSGSDVGSTRTSAKKVDGGYVLNGVKCFITNATLCSACVVLAVTNPDAGYHGMSLLLMEKSDAGVSVGKHEDKMGIRLSDTADFVMEDVFVPADRLIGTEGNGFAQTMKFLAGKRPVSVAGAVGVAQRALDLAVDYARERSFKHGPIAKLEGIQFLIADMEMRIQASRAMAVYGAQMTDAGIPIGTLGNSLKCFASEMCYDVVNMGLQVFAGYGYSREYPLEKLLRDARIYSIFEGTNQVQRQAAVPSTVNPFDKYALEAAVQLREALGGTVTAMTMGPAQAAQALRECYALGADRMVLVSDRCFGGADTYATSYTLAQAVRALGGFDLILCGRQAIDGDTAQVGPMLAEHLGLPQLTCACAITIEDGAIRIRQEGERAYRVLRAPLPAVVTVVKAINEPRLPNVMRKLQANRMQPQTLTADDLPALDPDCIGLHGSPTKVSKTFVPVRTKQTARIDGAQPEAAVASLLAQLDAAHISLEGGGDHV